MDRVLEAAPRVLNPGPPDRMTYENWVYFFMSEIDKTSREALCYWFATADLNMGALCCLRVVCLCLVRQTVDFDS